MARTPPASTPARAPAPTRVPDRGVLRAVALAVWLLAAAAFAALADFDTMRAPMLALLAVGSFLPAILITMVLLVAGAIAELRAEAGHLQGSVDALRRTMLDQARPDPALSPGAQSRLDSLSARQDQADTRLAMFFSHRAQAGRDAAAEAEGTDAQPRLALGAQDAPADAAPDAAMLIRALHFPEDGDDADGFAALRQALADARVAPLIKAAQDVLTRLAQEGIYMDDLRPERARPEFWRAFAAGARGAEIAPLGGIRDRSCLALCAGRMRADTEFRGAVHRFLRDFDRVFALFARDADDDQIAAMADTRSARAFMLLGRVSGVFSGPVALPDTPR